jgi:hypothetical protein
MLKPIIGKLLIVCFLILSWFALRGQTSEGVFIIKTNVGPYAQANSKQQVFGIVDNKTINTINQLTIHWQEGDGDIYTTTLKNLNIIGGKTHTFQHETSWNIGDEGSYSFKLWASNINDDSQWLSDTLSVDIYALSTTAQRMLLHESFSSTYCGTCANVNPIIRELAMKYLGKAFFIGYQTDCWAENPMCLLASQNISERMDLYNVQYTPYTVFSNWYKGNSIDFDATMFDAEIERPSPIAIEGNFSVQGASININANLTPYTNINIENLVLKVAIIQDIVSFDVAPGINGETTFYHVLRRFASAPAQYLENLENGEIVDISVSEDFSGLDVDLSQFRVGVFIQDTSTFEVIQAAELEKIPTGYFQTELRSFSIFPNPAKEIININFSDIFKGLYTVTIFGSTGQTLLTQHISADRVKQIVPLKISKLWPGVYMIRVVGPDFDQVQKLIVR